MIDFYYEQIEEQDYAANTWHLLRENVYFFKLNVAYYHCTFGTTLKIFNLTLDKYSTHMGFFMPNDSEEMYFIANYQNGSVELVSNIDSNLLYKIPWYYIPKNYLDFEPKHLIMMFNMRYLMSLDSMRDNNTTLYYNKYYHGIDIDKNEIEKNYVNFMIKNFSMDNIIVHDYLNF